MKVDKLSKRLEILLRNLLRDFMPHNKRDRDFKSCGFFVVNEEITNDF